MSEPTIDDIVANLRCELDMANAYIEDLERLNPDARAKIIAAGFEQKYAPVESIGSATHTAIGNSEKIVKAG